MRIRPFLLALVTAIASLECQAALPPRSSSDLRATADRIVVGVVEAIAKSDDLPVKGFADRNYIFSVRVESVEKGAQQAVVLARGWTVLMRPKGWAGPSGTYGVSELVTGEHVRLFLKELKGAAFEILEPNGIERLDLTPSERH